MYIYVCIYVYVYLYYGAIYFHRDLVSTNLLLARSTFNIEIDNPGAQSTFNEIYFYRIYFRWAECTCSSYVDHCHSVSFSGSTQTVSLQILARRRISWKLWVINNGHEQGHLKSYSGQCSNGCCRIIAKCKTQPYVLWPSKFNAEERKSIWWLGQISSETNSMKKMHGRYHEFHCIYSISLSLLLSLYLYLFLSSPIPLYPNTPYPFPDSTWNRIRYYEHLSTVISMMLCSYLHTSFHTFYLSIYDETMTSIIGCCLWI